MNNTIPPITHPLGRHWQQPSAENILLDDVHALMDRATFDALPEYSCSLPSGVYEGKMWKRNNGKYDARFIRAGGVSEWLLGWFGPTDDPDIVSIEFRKILFVD